MGYEGKAVVISEKGNFPVDAGANFEEPAQFWVRDAGLPCALNFHFHSFIFFLIINSIIVNVK